MRRGLGFGEGCLGKKHYNNYYKVFLDFVSMIEKLEPIQIYECPCCGIRNSDEGYIKQHIKESKRELPIGLVYNNGNRTYVVIGTYGFDKEHCASHPALSLDDMFDCITYSVNHSDFVMNCDAGNFSFLNETQFAEAEKKFSELRRTNPGRVEEFGEIEGLIRMPSEPLGNAIDRIIRLAQ